MLEIKFEGHICKEGLVSLMLMILNKHKLVVQIPTWFKKYGNWLEYNVTKEAAYCLCRYLFKPELEGQAGGDTFATEGFTIGKGMTNWQLMLKVLIVCIIDV